MYRSLRSAVLLSILNSFLETSLESVHIQMFGNKAPGTLVLYSN